MLGSIKNISRPPKLGILLQRDITIEERRRLPGEQEQLHENGETLHTKSTQELDMVSNRRVLSSKQVP